MGIIHVGLVDATGELNADLVQAAAVALNVQVTRDLPQFWPTTATVSYLPNSTRIPAGIWPVYLVKRLPPGEGGFHLTRHNQPYAKVIGTPNDASWTVDASHEILEMLVDPYGNRMQTSRAIKIAGGKIHDAIGEFNYLVEACDPCEANQYGYDIQGIAVSDFITPRFYDPLVTPGTRYSFTGAVKAPRQILPGGYISFVDQATDEWEQILWVDPNAPPELKQLGTASARSMREWIDDGLAKSELHPKQQHVMRSLKRETADRLNKQRTRLDEISARRTALFH